MGIFLQKVLFARPTHWTDSDCIKFGDFISRQLKGLTAVSTVFSAVACVCVCLCVCVSTFVCVCECVAVQPSFLSSCVYSCWSICMRMQLWFMIPFFLFTYDFFLSFLNIAQCLCWGLSIEVWWPPMRTNYAQHLWCCVRHADIFLLFRVIIIFTPGCCGHISIVPGNHHIYSWVFSFACVRKSYAQHLWCCVRHADIFPLFFIFLLLLLFLMEIYQKFWNPLSFFCL